MSGMWSTPTYVRYVVHTKMCPVCGPHQNMFGLWGPGVRHVVHTNYVRYVVHTKKCSACGGGAHPTAVGIHCNRLFLFVLCVISFLTPKFKKAIIFFLMCFLSSNWYGPSEGRAPEGRASDGRASERREGRASAR